MLARTAPLLAAIALALPLAACGGSGETSAPAPKLPRALAADLAERSDRIAETLDAGDVCSADQADDLQATAIGAINAGDVPPALQEDLQATANDLVDTINCPPPEKKDEDDDKGNGEDKGEKKGKDGDETTVSTTVSVTTG